MIQNGMTIGAASEYDAAAAFGERLADAVELQLDRIISGIDGRDEVEEAISENADLVRIAVMELIADSTRGAEIAQRLESMIRTHLTPSVMREAERAATWGE